MGRAGDVADWWVLTLECGHTVRRKVIKRQKAGYGGRGSGEDPAPQWVYCEFCAGEGEEETKAEITDPTVPRPPWEP